MIAPSKIKIVSDNNELVFVDFKKGIYKYQYSKSKEKKGQYLELDEVQLLNILKTNTL